MPIKVMVTDDHPIVIKGLRNTLAAYEHIQFMDAFTNGVALLEALKTAQPDVLLLDVRLPDIQGNELARIITEDYPAVRILALTSLDTIGYAKKMLQNGCTGYLLKYSEEDSLIQAIETVYAGERYIDESLKEGVLRSIARREEEKIPALTTREKEVLELIASGKTCPQIAEALYISVRTAENHRSSIMQKLEVNNTALLITTAFKLGIIDREYDEFN